MDGNHTVQELSAEIIHYRKEKNKLPGNSWTWPPTEIKPHPPIKPNQIHTRAESKLVDYTPHQVAFVCETRVSSSRPRISSKTRLAGLGLFYHAYPSPPPSTSPSQSSSDASSASSSRKSSICHVVSAGF